MVKRKFSTISSYHEIGVVVGGGECNWNGCIGSSQDDSLNFKDASVITLASLHSDQQAMLIWTTGQSNNDYNTFRSNSSQRPALIIRIRHGNMCFHATCLKR